MRRHRSIHEVDISDLEAALRSDDPGKVHETPREEIARLRKMELEPQHYDVDINKEVRPGGTSTGLGHPRCRRVDPTPASCRILEPKRVPVRVVGAGGGQGGGCWCGDGSWWPVLSSAPAAAPQLSTPDKVLIPERYIELEPDTPLSPEEMKEKQKKVERIKTLIAKSR